MRATGNFLHLSCILRRLPQASVVSQAKAQLTAAQVLLDLLYRTGVALAVSSVAIPLKSRSLTLNEALLRVLSIQSAYFRTRIFLYSQQIIRYLLRVFAYGLEALPICLHLLLVSTWVDTGKA